MATPVAPEFVGSAMIVGPDNVPKLYTRSAFTIPIGTTSTELRASTVAGVPVGGVRSATGPDVKDCALTNESELDPVFTTAITSPVVVSRSSASLQAAATSAA